MKLENLKHPFSLFIFKAIVELFCKLFKNSCFGNFKNKRTGNLKQNIPLFQNTFCSNGENSSRKNHCTTLIEYLITIIIIRFLTSNRNQGHFSSQKFFVCVKIMFLRLIKCKNSSSKKKNTVTFTKVPNSFFLKFLFHFCPFSS